jgi:hypothetical protein
LHAVNVGGGIQQRPNAAEFGCSENALAFLQHSTRKEPNHRMDAQTTTNTKPPRSELLDASYAALDSKAATDDARKLVDTLCAQITATEERLGRRQHQRVKTAAQFRTAVEAFVADLLRAHAYGNGLAYRSLRPASFTGKAVSYRRFVTVNEHLTEMGLVESWPGYQDTVQFEEGGPKLGYNRCVSACKIDPVSRGIGVQN